MANDYKMISSSEVNQQWWTSSRQSQNQSVFEGSVGNGKYLYHNCTVSFDWFPLTKSVCVRVCSWGGGKVTFNYQFLIGKFTIWLFSASTMFYKTFKKHWLLSKHELRH